MAHGQPSGRTARTRRSDDGIASVVGTAMIIAIMVAVYAHTVHASIPRWGEDAERQWDRDVAVSFNTLARAAGNGVGVDSPLSVTVPPAPAARTVDLPFAGHATTHHGSGSVAFEPSCARFQANHTPAGGSRIVDIANASRGCITFHASPVYTDAFGFRVEFGGLLRVQGSDAVVLAGLPLDLNATDGNQYRVTLSLPGLRGPARSAASDESPVRVDLALGPAAPERLSEPIAGSTNWTLESKHPLAWKRWFEQRFQDANFVANRSSPGAGESAKDYEVACVPSDCSTNADGLGKVKVTIHGPRTDRNDLQLSVSYGLYDVSVH